VGSPSENIVVRMNNKKHGFVDSYFPGKGKGIISIIDDFLETGRPIIYAGGDDWGSAKKAILYLIENIKVPPMNKPQFRVISPELRPRPWMRRGKEINEVKIIGCKNETEPLHLLIYTPGEIKNIKIITHVKSPGEKILSPEIFYIPWSFPGVGIKGEIYPEGKQTITPDGNYPLPQRKVHPDSINKGNKPVPFVFYRPNNDAMWKGYPKNLPSDRLTSIWFNFKFEEDIPSGEYPGKILIRWDNGSKEIPIRIKIVDIKLPNRWAMDFNPMHGIYSYNKNVFKLYLGIPERDEKLYLQAIKNFGNLLWTHGATVAALPRYDIKISIFPDKKIQLNTEELDKVINAYREGKFEGKFTLSLHPNFLLPIVKAIALNNKISEKEAWIIVSQKIKEWIISKNLSGKIIVRVGDEPGNADKWVEEAKKLKDSGMLITVCHNRNDENFLRKMVGTINIWCPLWNRAITGWMGEIIPEDDPKRFNKRFFEERRKAGDIIWNYSCTTPYFSFTRIPTEINFYFYDSFNKGFNGAVYYGGGNWAHMWGPSTFLPGVKGGYITHRDNYVYDVYSYGGKGWHGGTFLIYPDARRHSVLSSQRFEIVRQSQEDLKLFSLIRKKFGQKELNKLLSSVVSPRNHHDIPPEDFLKVREKAIMLLLNGGEK